MSGPETPEPVETEAPDETTPAETEVEEQPDDDEAGAPDPTTTDIDQPSPPDVGPRFDVPHGDEKTEEEAEEEDSSLTD